MKLALMATLLCAGSGVLVQEDASIRTGSLPTPKAIKRRAPSPPGQKKETPASPKAEVPPVDGLRNNDFLKRLTTEMENFERDWARRRGVNVEKKESGKADIWNDLRQASKQIGDKINIDDLLTPEIKEVVAPIAEEAASGKDFASSIRQATQQVLSNPDSLRALTEKLFDGNPELKKAIDRISPKDVEKALGKDDDIFSTLFGSKKADGGKEEDPFAALFGGNGNKKKNPWASLFGVENQKKKPINSAFKDLHGKKKNADSVDEEHFDSSVSEEDSWSFDEDSERFGGL